MMPSMAKLLLAVELLGLAQAMRTQKTETVSAKCDFEEFTSAKVTKRGKNVEVSVCGSSVLLAEGEPNEEAWAGVDWWRPSLQNQKLTKADVTALQNYMGSYTYARPVGELLRGMLPRIEKRGLKSRNHKDLVQKILKYQVKLATALNKLPSPSSPMTVWRGAWIASDVLADARDRLKSGKAMFFPWIQATTAAKSYAYYWSQTIRQPPFCDPDCIENEEAFPTLYEIQSCRVKDVRKWNPDEAELDLLPNMPLKIDSITKLQNDPWQDFTWKELADWLETPHDFHELILENNPELPKVAGPFPKLAEVVRKHKISGVQFLYRDTDMQRFRDEFPDLDAATSLCDSDPDVAMDPDKYPYCLRDYDEYDVFSTAVEKNRFNLPPYQGKWGIEASKYPFMYEIHMSDAEPC